MCKFRFFAPWLWVLILCLGGIAAYSVPGYRFSGCVLFAAAFVVVCYQLLRLLSAKKPKLARRLQRILTAVLCVFLLAYAITGVIIITASFGDVHTEGCDYLRLDCARHNRQLNDYYETHGFVLVGDDPGPAYMANLREKKLRD